MLIPLDRSPDPARPYRLPWRVDRSTMPHPRVAHIGSEPADAVRAFASDGGAAAQTQHWGLVLPRDVCEICLCDSDPLSTIVTIAWFRFGTDEEFVWRFAL